MYRRLVGAVVSGSFALTYCLTQNKAESEVKAKSSLARLRERKESLEKKWDYQNKATRLSPIVWPKNFPEEDEIPLERLNLAKCSKSFRCRSSPEWLNHCADTQFKLATSLTIMQTSVESLNEGAIMMQDLAELGHADGMCGYGMLLSDGKGVESNSVEAVRYWEKAVREYQHPHATYELGVAYYQGEGVEEDESRALEYFRKAAQTEHTGAMYMLGDSLLEGIGCQVDTDAAVDWLYKAAEKGHRGARSRLLALISDDGSTDHGQWSDSSRQSFRRRNTKIGRRLTVKQSRS